MKNKNEYKNGMLKVAQRMIWMCEKEIEKLKEIKWVPGSPKQIATNARMGVYKKLLQKMQVSKSKMENSDR